MRKWVFALAGLWALAGWAAVSVPQAAQGPAPAARQTSARPAAAQVQSAQAAPGTATEYRAVLDKYCVSCHNERAKIPAASPLLLDKLDASNVHPNAAEWEKVVRKLRVGMMPPIGMPRPDAATYEGLVSFLQTSLDTAPPNPGRPRGMHRLNRAEYANAIRDVLALDLDVTTLLPPDDSSYGFDNVADVLGVSPSLQERYLAAATRISAIAVGDTAQFELADEETFQVRPDSTQLQHNDALPLGTRGGGLFYKVFPVDGDYHFQVKMFRTNLGNMRGLDFPHTVIITLDGNELLSEVVGGEIDAQPGGGDNNATTRGDKVDARLQVRVPVKAGRHAVGVAFVEKTQAESPFTLQPFEAVLDHIDGAGISKIDIIKVNGPFNITGPGDTPSRRRVFTCRPATQAEEAGCARTILMNVARRAYRRPVTDADAQLLLNFFNQGRKDGNFDSAVGLALRYILASPEFVFRVERDPATVAAGGAYRLSDVEMASRLSFFLWSSVPDEELLTVASQGRLRNRTVLQQQVRRMLADPKAEALTTNFAGQWLYLRNLRNHLPNYNEFPDFDDNLRKNLRSETEMLFASIVNEDRSVIDLLNANYTFLNERLARHYDIPGIYGSHFRRVTIADENRRGLLGQGSILTVTSHPNTTSPVKRGKWVLENLLGTPPPEPPPGVPPLPMAAAGTKPKTMREQMEAHRANPTCASCHQLMDPIGFAMENFDGIGAYRTIYPGTPSSPGSAINSAGQLADGSKINGAADLRQALLRKSDVFVQTMTEKMLVYALGRGLDYYDMPTVRKIVRDASRNDYKFQSIVMGIVTSAPFEMRVKTPSEPAATTAARQ